MKNDLSILCLRLSFSGTMLISHGLPKFLNYSQMKNSFPDPLGIGSSACLLLTIFAEFICPFFILLGYKLRFFTVPLIITMLVAAFVIHADDNWSKIEFPLLYAFSFLALLISGAGKYSLDRKLS